METASSRALCDSSPRKECAPPAEHVIVSNYGWYLFNCIPLVCGNANPNASLPWRFFSDHVNPVLLHNRLTEYASSKNAGMSNLVFSRDEEVFFDIPGSDIPFPIPYFVCYREVQFSCVLTKRPTDRNVSGEDKSR